MKTQLSVISFLTFLLLSPYFLSCYNSANAQASSGIVNEINITSTPTPTTTPTPEEVNKAIEASKQREAARKRASDFFTNYPYETSRILFLCHRTGAVKARLFSVSGGSNYVNEFIVQEYFRTDSPLPDPILSSIPSVNSNVNKLFQLAENLRNQPSLDEPKIQEVDNQLKTIITSLTSYSSSIKNYSETIPAQIAELSKIDPSYLRANTSMDKGSNQNGNRLLAISNTLKSLQSWRNVRGVGVRVTAEINSLVGELNADNLFSFFSLPTLNGAKIRGTISVEIFGLGGRAVSNAVNITTELNPQTALKSQESIFQIRKAVIDKSEGELNPIELTLSPTVISPPKFDESLCIEAK
ncbi:MAG: hypothetical protein IM585_09665 [Pseudanabaena sp. M135S2SP2A07QC]|nr:hypothetical protein [Pseudanabaena sp. M090S1SP2A07QC]MCA6506540.1 hypothetical protein [Pseudanabaena sp. M172S2SP2A07QC]MCA6520397.1 hypothetical protein [Pseudanabaena sp. M051S1SP2A07QC]MCA6526206.1 hypothetical protein [Pseudanabaena sp. M179S2SP2A07QC]MCA6530116.1 hypothetical protein [Pseudanabaena sp. M125S2SP2A07QC]MCA6535804.1 hypothetical protein [Pseudanabaena sp. M176S2SP2A07QC]MCA6540911.1 hypothetical protein [Pseudanabaena sp. M037S2SP2A07QC]MCA6545257.1 hypothetical prot